MAKFICLWKAHIINMIPGYEPFCSRCTQSVDQLGIPKIGDKKEAKIYEVTKSNL